MDYNFEYKITVVEDTDRDAEKITIRITKHQKDQRELQYISWERTTNDNSREGLGRELSNLIY